MDTLAPATQHEREVQLQSGWVMLPICLGLLLGAIGLLIYFIVAASRAHGGEGPAWEILPCAILLIPVAIIMLCGLFTLQPNEARVLILFGKYKGTVRQAGFHWGNPFYSNGDKQLGAATAQKSTGGTEGRSTGNSQRRISTRNKVSLRARTFNAEKLKVNDKRGNPIEIGAVLVWRVQDTAQASFDVDDYQKYVQTQSETALRHLASDYAYDDAEQNEWTLRGNVDETSQALRQELQERLGRAGVIVDEARLTHLAYAPEIAQAMLRRQQAEAIIAARQKIVHGAVSMVDMALKDLAERQVVQLDDERRAVMVSNLMVVLCGETEVHPIINTGTLYT